ncbi:hypothetical protein C5167_021293 [Papaver somniferum]|uniref:Uncharacterized protein n=1 Tax=Papaver somniferum TaxID=3469 RepID=A0A4Y7IVH7_PAPSO|nr:hypothetical protein C5167_021293 [Papaver somniferum]
MYHPSQLWIFADVYTNDEEIESQSRLVSNGSGQTTVEIWHSIITNSLSFRGEWSLHSPSFLPTFYMSTLSFNNRRYSACEVIWDAGGKVEIQYRVVFLFVLKELHNISKLYGDGEEHLSAAF